MENREYYRLTEYQQKEVAKQEALVSEKEVEKLHLWNYSRGYGWTQHGRQSGYKTIKELKEDNRYSIRKEDIYRITKSVIVEENKCI